MLNHTIGAVRKYGAKVAATGSALVLSAAAHAQATSTADTIVTKVEDAFSKGELIAGAVVLGLFTLFAIKLLWRSK